STCATMALPRSSAITEFWKRSSGPTPTPTKIAISSGSSPSERTSNSSTLSGRSCKTRNFPACTLPSATPMARIPARSGIPALTLTWWGRASISGLTASRSWTRAASLSRPEMVPALREEFNRNFAPEKYRQLLQHLGQACGMHIGFRVSETPCFVPKALLDQMSQYGRELVLQLVDNPEYRPTSDASVPPQYNVPNESPLPMFVQVDFGVVRTATGELEPKLVELQAFPSLYGYQALSAHQYIETYELPSDLGIYLSGYEPNSYWKLMRELIVAGQDPENVI